MKRKRMLGLIFEEIRANAVGVTALAPREDWKAYVRAVVPFAAAGVQSGRRDLDAQ